MLKEKLSQERSSPHEHSKLILLALAACFIAATYAILRPLKISIFFRLVGKEYYPWSKIALVLFVVPCMAIYSRLVDKLKKHHLLYSLFIFYALLIILFALVFTQQSLAPLTGWLFLISMDLFPTFVIGTFWAFINSISTPAFAKKRYGTIVAATKVGGLLAAGMSFLVTYNHEAEPNIISFLIFIASILLIFSLLFIVRLIRIIPQEELAGYQALCHKKPITQKKKKPFQIIEGLRFMLATPYVFGIFLLFYCYEVIFTIVEYQATVLLDLQTGNSTIQMSSMLFLTTFISQVLGLLCALFGTAMILKRLSMRFALMVMPLATAGLVLALLFWPTLPVMLGVMTLLPTLNFGLNSPIREMLFIPTIKEIQFKSKAWIDSFGRTLSKTSGSTVNLLFLGAPIGAFFAFNAIFSLLLAGTWSAIAFFMGRKYEETTAKREIIGEK